MIRKILIANRGEIACRIAATARMLGRKVVTVYTASECDLPHVFAGDEAVCLEGEGLASTYLNSAQLVEVARRTGCDAIHPGYGFLSENAAFSRSVKQAGLAFIGPSAEVIALMGDKAAARAKAEALGVPVVPGYHAQAQDVGTLQGEASRIGYPVLIKAAAGGGGKGMRVVEEAAHFEDALMAAQSEAQRAFGDSRVILEKYVVKPRHVEVQIFSDSKGNHVHLLDRDCSVQRRHQKVLEECPAPDMPEASRKRMRESAVHLAQEIGYLGAGTVEFMLGADGAVYFLEMNTRLQVEHPVTEMVTGTDLVRWQIEVADGNALPLTQEQIIPRGHAVEARLYAEDAERGFLPVAGKLEQLQFPSMPWLRVESGYATGNEVSAAFDPMIAKLVAWGSDRREACARLHAALSQTQIAGIITNRAFLMRVLNSKAFLDAELGTHFLTEHQGLLQPQALTQDEKARLVGAFLLVQEQGKVAKSHAGAEVSDVWKQSALAGFRHV